MSPWGIFTSLRFSTARDLTNGLMQMTEQTSSQCTHDSVKGADFIQMLWDFLMSCESVVGKRVELCLLMGLLWNMEGYNIYTFSLVNESFWYNNLFWNDKTVCEGQNLWYFLECVWGICVSLTYKYVPLKEC